MGVENRAKAIRGRVKSREKMRTSRTRENLTAPISYPAWVERRWERGFYCQLKKWSGSPSLLIRQAMHIMDFAFKVDAFEGKGGLLKTNKFS